MDLRGSDHAAAHQEGKRKPSEMHGILGKANYSLMSVKYNGMYGNE